MANTEVDLDEDSGLSEDVYLNELLERAPSVDSLLSRIRDLPVFRGFYVSVPCDESPYSLSKSEVLKMLNPTAGKEEGAGEAEAIEQFTL